MPWTRSAIIDEETFAGPSDEQFVEFDGIFERTLDLNLIGSWTTMWVVFLMSAKAERKDFGAPVSGSYRFQLTPNQMIGIRSSGSAVTPTCSPVTELGNPRERQYAGNVSSLSGDWRNYLDSNSDYWMSPPTWACVYREDGTGINFSGGYQNYFSLETGPSIRRPFAFTFKKSNPFKMGWSGSGATLLTDYTKAQCKAWLLAHSTTLNFLVNRPTGNTYNGEISSGIDMDEGTYGAFDTIFFGANTPGVKWRCHGLWGRTFAGEV